MFIRTVQAIVIKATRGLSERPSFICRTRAQGLELFAKLEERMQHAHVCQITLAVASIKIQKIEQPSSSEWTRVSTENKRLGELLVYKSKERAIGVVQ